MTRGYRLNRLKWLSGFEGGNKSAGITSARRGAREE